MKGLIVTLLLVVILCCQLHGQGPATIVSYRVDADFPLDADPEKFVWQQPFSSQTIVEDWQGENADWALETTVKSLWTPSYLYLLFEAKYDELVTDSAKLPDKNGDTFGIWDHDVVELFIGDNPDIRKYYEFVVSPLGQHIDIAHNKNKPKEESFDTSYQSGWEVAATVDPFRRCWIAEFRIPMASIANDPAVIGKSFQANAYRCARQGEQRTYLALNPTEWPTPSFHHPEKFGRLVLAAAQPELPRPIVDLDFEPTAECYTKTLLGFVGSEPHAAIVPGQGLAGSHCLDMGWPKPHAAPIVEDEGMTARLAQARSLTITGWLHRKVDFNDEDVQHQYVLSGSGFKLMTHGRYSHRMAMLVDGADGKRRELWTGWMHDFQPPQRWIFFAFTYDSTSDQDNAAIYFGYEQYGVHREGLKTLPTGELAINVNNLVIGANTAKGDSPFKGRIDSLRIYTAEDGSAALNPDQLEVIRRMDVTDEFRRNYVQKQSRRRRQDIQAFRQAISNHWSAPLAVQRIDPLHAVYPDRPPQLWQSDQPVCIPRGDHMLVMVGCRVQTDTMVEFDGQLTGANAKDGDARIDTYHVLPVPIEANNNGGCMTQIGVKPSPYWMEQITREAPYEVCEVLVPADKVELKAGRWYALLVDIDTSTQTPPGAYTGQVNLTTEAGKASIPFEFDVAQAAIGDHFALQSVHWMWADPDNFVVEGETPQWWSPEHWRLLELSGKAMRCYGQDTMFTPIVNGRYPLIQTIRGADGSYTFDFTRFDRWFKTFLAQGYRNFNGQHVGGGHEARPMEVWVLDEKTGQAEKIFDKESDVDSWYAFLETFYPVLFAHLQKRGWTDYYAQAQLDEPGDVESYMRIASLARKHMPGIRTIDAINGSPEDYSPHVDIQVFNSLLARAPQQKLAVQRRSEGKGVWYYHCCSPYPPYPNRHLDEPLTGSRLYPWLCYMLNADGYLFWAANVLRGANPYVTSVGPLPGGSQSPGHPPGDNWMFYPSKDGMLGTLRMAAFRQGMVDHDLLTRLAERDPDAAGRFMRQIARNLLDYETDPQVYRRVRRDLLEALEQ